MKRTMKWFSLAAVLTGIVLVYAQQPDASIVIVSGKKAALAVPDLRGTGEAAQHMAVFNETLWSDLDESSVFTMVAKSMYPLEVPQRPEDFKAPASAPAGRKAPWLTDWSGPPANASHLAFGYVAVQDNQLMLLGWLYDVTQADTANAQLLQKRYFGPVTPDGARKMAHEFAADILRYFGVESIANAKVYFVSDRTGNKEIWSMESDGANPKPATRYGSITTTPTVSLDGLRLAFTTYARGTPGIYVHSLETGRRLPFYNQNASMNATPAFTPDGKQLLYSSTASGYAQIYLANADGSDLRRLTNARAVEVEPKPNPKGGTVAFVSGRSGPPQIYTMSMDGTSVERLTTGEGEAVNPSWHPDGQHIAFAWSRGYEPGNFNIFIMEVASRKFIQLTHGAGRNENPSWAPDGRHLVFSSNRSGSSQIWTMLADGTKLKRLTSEGRNTMPVWGK